MVQFICINHAMLLFIFAYLLYPTTGQLYRKNKKSKFKKKEIKFQIAL